MHTFDITGFCQVVVWLEQLCFCQPWRVAVVLSGSLQGLFVHVQETEMQIQSPLDPLSLPPRILEWFAKRRQSTSSSCFSTCSCSDLAAAQGRWAVSALDMADSCTVKSTRHMSVPLPLVHRLVPERVVVCVKFQLCTVQPGPSSRGLAVFLLIRRRAHRVCSKLPNFLLFFLFSFSLSSFSIGDGVLALWQG